MSQIATAVRCARWTGSDLYLLDTNVVSIGAPTKKDADLGLERWLKRNNDRLFLSTVTIAELEGGIAKARRLGSARKADLLAEWLERLMHFYSARILPVDLAVARVLGKLLDEVLAGGRKPEWADLAIAATALSQGYTVLTTNIRHFRYMTVRFHDPFESLPSD